MVGKAIACSTRSGTLVGPGICRKWRPVWPAGRFFMRLRPEALRRLRGSVARKCRGHKQTQRGGTTNAAGQTAWPKTGRIVTKLLKQKRGPQSPRFALRSGLYRPRSTELPVVDFTGGPPGWCAIDLV